MFHPTTVDAATPRAVRTFISQVMDTYAPGAAACRRRRTSQTLIV
jgi:hypothetical protein